MLDIVRHRQEIAGLAFEDLTVGMSGIFEKTVTEADIVLFSGVTGDMNPIHVNENFAKETPFGGRIAHGMLTASLISTVLGTKMPGPGCIYLWQNLKFMAPVRIGDTVTARAVVTELIPEKLRARLRTTASVGDVVVCEGDAGIKVPRSPAS